MFAAGAESFSSVPDDDVTADDAGDSDNDLNHIVSTSTVSPLLLVVAQDAFLVVLIVISGFTVHLFLMRPVVIPVNSFLVPITAISADFRKIMKAADVFTAP